MNWGAKSRKGEEGVAFVRAGMTLIEVMIVVSLIAALISITAFSLGFLGQADVRAEALRFSGVVRFIYNQSATQNRTLQLVIDLDEERFTVDELTVSGGMTLEDLRGETLQTSMDDDEDEVARSSRLDDEDMAFSAAQRAPRSGPLLSEEDSVLAEGVHFIGVMTSHHESLQREGIATINFFPSGYVERSIIYIGDDKADESDDEGSVYTLIINPLTGQSTIKPGRTPIEDRFFEEEEDR